MATEATVQDLVQAVQTLQQQNATLVQQVQHLQQQLPGGRAGGDVGGPAGRKGDAVEKLLKRTDGFDGNNFQEWKFRLETSLRATVPEAADLVKWAENESETLDGDSVVLTHHDREIDNLVYYFLTAACKGEAFDIVRNVPDTCGAEAWRKLCKRFGAKTRGRKVVLLRKCVNPAKIKKLSEAPAIIEKWESDIRRLQADYQETLSDGVKCGILLEMVPANITEFMTQRMGEDDMYEDTKEHVLRYVQTKADFGGIVPMDVDGFMEPEWSQKEEPQGREEDNPGAMMALGGKGGKGAAPSSKGGGKGKGQGNFQGTCNLCGEWGHRAAQCPWKNHCFHCWQPGHTVSQCPVKDAEMKGRGKDGNKGYGKGGGKDRGWSFHGGKGSKGSGKGPNWPKGGYGRGSLHGCWDGHHDHGHDPSNDGTSCGNSQAESPGPVWGLFGLQEGCSGGWHTVSRRGKAAAKKCHLWHGIPPGLHDDFGIPTAVFNKYQSLMDDMQDEDEEEKDFQVGVAVSGEMMGLFANENDLNSLGEKEEWVVLDTVIDSGAADSVAPVDMASWVPLAPSAGSKRGQTWQSACGEVLPNMGERNISGYSEEGEPVELLYQVAEVSKALGSVSRTCDRGNRVVFEANGGYIENLKTGKCTTFNRERNVYVMKTWVKKPAGQQINRPSAGFRRQG